MGYISDYVFYNSGNHCPESFQIWSALSLLGSIAGHKIYYDQDYFRVRPNLYVILVGSPGSGKSIAQDQIRHIMVEHFPDYYISETIQSREDIAKKMAEPGCIRTWKDAQGVINEYHPFFMIADEFESLLSVAPEKMVQFLVVMHSAKYFGTGFKNTESQKRFPNPFLSLHACAPTDFLMTELKLALFRGGLGRRLILVPDERKKKIAHPKIPEGGHAAYKRVIEHLTAAHEEALQGNFVMTPEADAWWVKWFESPWENKTDPILMQFDSTKGVMVLKVSMLLALDTRPFRLVIEKIHLETALAMLDQLTPKIAQMTSGVGRNELAGVGVLLLSHIDRVGGAVPEVELKRHFNRYLNTPEFRDVLQHFLDTEQLVIAPYKINGTEIERRFYFTPSRYREVLAARQLAHAHEQPPGGGSIPPATHLSS